MITDDPRRLQGQMQAYAACDDPDVRAVVRRGFGRLVELVESEGGSRRSASIDFFAVGMLINVMASMELCARQDEPWADAAASRGCGTSEGASLFRRSE